VGDKPGHPFRGNQWGSAAVAEPGLLSRLSKTERLQLQKTLDDADEALGYEAQNAISEFVGHGPKAREYAEETGGFGVMAERRLEDAMSANPSPEGLIVRDQLEAAFAPIREKLRGQFGDNVDLFRVQREVAENAKPRNVLSFTLSRAFAKDYAGAGHEAKVYSAKEIDEMEARAQTSGKIEVGNHELRRGTDGYWDIYKKADEYGGEEFITDADSPRQYIRSKNASAVEWNQRNAAKLRHVVRTEVPLSRVVWATQRANQWEFIVRTGDDKRDASGWTPPHQIVSRGAEKRTGWKK